MSSTGIIQWDLTFLGGIKTRFSNFAKVVFEGFPLDNALFGLVSYNDPCTNPVPHLYHAHMINMYLYISSIMYMIEACESYIDLHAMISSVTGKESLSSERFEIWKLWFHCFH